MAPAWHSEEIVLKPPKIDFSSALPWKSNHPINVCAGVCSWNVIWQLKELLAGFVVEGNWLCCSSLKASRGGMFPGIAVGIGVKACPGCCPSALLLSCSLSWVYALGRAGKLRQEGDGTIRGLFQQGGPTGS